MNLCKSILISLLLIYAGGSAHADDDVHAHYLANAGVLIVYGETKVVFDPLFDNDYDTYESVPPDIERDLFAGAPPFDGLDAVFVSHHHGDHFSPQRMMRLLQSHPDLQLFAPKQAVDALMATAGGEDTESRVHAISLDFDGRYSHNLDGISINAVRLPHSGWPSRHADVENLAFHVTLPSEASVLHMGDAHTDERFYADQADYWAERKTLLALPPYWMFLAESGRKILERRVGAHLNIGVHVPASIPDKPSNYPDELKGRTLFTVPGESRTIPLPAPSSDAN